MGDIKYPIGYLHLFGDWGLLSHDNRAREKYYKLPLNHILPIGYIRSPIGNGIPNSIYFLLLVYWFRLFNYLFTTQIKCKIIWWSKLSDIFWPFGVVEPPCIFA